jgi:hypothetical protein
MSISVRQLRRVDKIALTVLTYVAAGAPTLQELGGNFSALENIAEGALIGTLTNTAFGSTLALIDDAGGRVALDGYNIVRGPTGLDFEGGENYSFTVEETLDAQVLETVLTLT